jgi:hypothetical protein
MVMHLLETTSSLFCTNSSQTLSTTTPLFIDINQKKSTPYSNKTGPHAAPLFIKEE